MAYNITLEGKNRKKAEALLMDVTEFLDKHKIQYALEGGTLLGIYRENRLLPWDSDVDLSILSSELNKLESILKELTSKGYRVRTRFSKFEEPPFKKGSIRIIKIRNKRFFGLVKGKVCLEIFVKYVLEDKVYWKVADKTMYAPKSYYESYDSIEFLNRKLYIPSQTENYLTHKYGDWTKTIKTWDAITDEKSLIKNQ